MGLRPSFPLIRALIVAYILLVGPLLFAAAFKSYAPKNWKLVSQKGDNAIYKNTQSEDNETIVLQAFPAQANDADLITKLNLQTLTREREKFLNGFGIGNYTALAVRTGRAKDTRFSNYTEIDSLYRDLQNRDVQMIERQFVANGTMYVISYLIDGPAINDRKRANRALDSFQPIRKPQKNAELIPHLEPINVASLFSCNSLIATGLRYLTPEAEASDVATSSSIPEPANNLPSTATPVTVFVEEKLSDSNIARRCQDVPPEKRRTAGDSPFLEYVKSSWKMPGSCLMGVADNAWDVVKGAYDFIKGSYKILFNEEYRSEVRATVGVVAAEVYKSPTAFALRLASQMAASLQKYAGETFPCLKPTEQVKAVCKLASNLIGAGMLAKVLAGVPFATERWTALAADAVDGVKGVTEVGNAKVARVENAAPKIIDENDPDFLELYKKAPSAKTEIDKVSNEVAAKYGGKVIEAPIKSKARALEKVNTDYEGDIGELKDIVRNTIVVPHDKIQTVAKEIEQIYTKEKAEIRETLPELNLRGWSMTRVLVRTENEVRGEIQINSPEMIYAGFDMPKARSILGKAQYNALSKKIGMQGGLSHTLYEIERVLSDADPDKSTVRDLSVTYHNIIREAASGETRLELKSKIDEFKIEYKAFMAKLRNGR